MRVALALPPEDHAISDAIRQRIAGIEIVRETPYFNRSILDLLVKLAPDVVIIGEDLPGDGDITLLQLVYGLRCANIRVIFLSHARQQGDPFLSDLVSLGVTDLVLGGAISIRRLEEMIRTPTPWADVGHLLIPGRRPDVQEVPEPPAPPAESGAGAAPEEEKGEEPPAAPKSEPKAKKFEVPLVRRRVVVEETSPPVQAPVAPQKGTTVLVGLSPEGTGVTTTAISLAALWGEAGCRTALVDLDPVFPSVATLLQVPPTFSGLNFLLQGERSEDSAAETYGIRVFNSPAYPAEPAAARMTEAHLIRIMDRLRGDHERIIIDAGHRIDHPAVRAALQVADEVLIVVDLDAYRVIVASHRWPAMAQITNPDKCRLVINRVPAQAKRIQPADVAAAFAPAPVVATTLPLVPEATDAPAKGKPLSLYVGRDHEYTRALRTLVDPPKKAGRWPFWRR